MASSGKPRSLRQHPIVLNKVNIDSILKYYSAPR